MASPSVPSTSLPAPSNEEPTEISALAKAKLTAVFRFKTFTQQFSSKQEPKIIFPPPSWFITDDTNAPNEVGTNPSSVSTEAPADGSGLDTPEPTTFAQKIRQLIDLLPLPASIAGAVGSGSSTDGIGAPPEGVTDGPTPIAVDSQGPPIPDVVDARTIKYLSSEDVMNGDTETPGSRQSVWYELERIKRDESPATPHHNKSDAAATRSENRDEPEEGVMMYAPLEPAADSEIELAESELEYVEATPDKAEGRAGATKAPITSQPARPKKHWVPSTTKISVFTAWWGYRLYLPPPVMATLGSNQLKATQRAAMIITALQWFLKKVPTTFLPPQVRPAVKMLQCLSPILGYIGVFIAWSWTRITKYDQGNGVVLSATWLLPVALIPMSWDAGDIQGPPIRPRTPTIDQEQTEKNKGDDNNSKKGKEKR